MMQLIRCHGRRIRHRLDGRLRAPMLRDEGDGAPHRIIVAQRGVLGSRFGEAVLIHGEVHHGLGCRLGARSKPPDSRSAVHEIGLWVGPRLAACSAAVKALAKLAFSSGPRKLPIAKWRPLETR